MSRKQKLPFLALHYDKVVLVVAAALFGGAVFALKSGTAAAADEAGKAVRNVEKLKANPAHPVLKRLSPAAFDAAMEEAEEPFQLGTNTTFLVAAERVACVKCAQPIPITADNCAYCGAEQPSDVLSEDWDTDGDGMPDVWEKKMGFNPLDPTDAALDADNDGFTNLEEYKEGTDPRSAASHPPRFHFLQVSEIEATPFPYLLKGKSRQPDGEYKFQVNSTARNQTHYLRKGDKLPGTDFTLAEYETKREVVKRPGLPDKEQDVFYLTFRRGEDFVELKENGTPVSSAFEVTLVCSKDRTGQSWHVKRLETFEMDGEKFTLVSVNPKQGSAVIKRAAGGEEILCPAK